MRGSEEREEIVEMVTGEQEKVEMCESEGEGSMPSGRWSREKQLGVGGLKAGQQRDSSVATGPVNSSTGTGLD